MVKKEWVEKFKNALVVVLVGSVISCVPFYFETNARTRENGRVNEQQEVRLNGHEQLIQEGRVNDAVIQTESAQIKASLERIEQKLDRLIEKQPGLIN